MFGKLFKKNKDNQSINKEKELPVDPAILPFEMLVMEYLKNYGIDKFGNDTGVKMKLSQEEMDWIVLTLKAAGFIEETFIEELIIEEWHQIKENNTGLTPSIFAPHFVIQYHNIKIERFVSDDIIERNKNLASAYSDIVDAIEKIQGWLEHEDLRTRIETDSLQIESLKTTISQCTTPFCIVSLGCDEVGRYNLVYSVDPRIQEILPNNFASILIRRIYDFTPGAMESFVRIGSLYEDCIQTFEQLMEEAKTLPFHKVIVKEQH